MASSARSHASRLRLCCIILAILPAGAAWPAEPTWAEWQNLPVWARTIFQDRSFSAVYAVSTRLNPFFLQGDFNGDGRPDLAVLVVRRTTGAEGIAFLHTGDAAPLIVGAGTSLGNGGTDFSWMDAWNLTRNNRKSPHRDALFVQKLEAASAMIYWDGKTYRWTQQGD